MTNNSEEIARRLKYGWTLPEKIGPWSLYWFEDHYAGYVAVVKVEDAEVTAKIQMGPIVTIYCIQICSNLVGDETVNALIKSSNTRKSAAETLVRLLEEIGDKEKIISVLKQIKNPLGSVSAPTYEGVDEFLESVHLMEDGKRW